MKKKLVYILITLIFFSIIIVFLLHNKKEIDNLDNRAINIVKDYIKDNNIVINDSLYVELKNINNNTEFMECNTGSGVFINNENDNLKYSAFLKCPNYITKVNDKMENISLNGQEILILNIEEEFIDPGYNSLYDVTVIEKNYDNIDFINYYVSNNGEVINIIQRVIIYTHDKTKNINGTDNNEYPSITLYGDRELKSFYNIKYTDPGYAAHDDFDGDLTDKVAVTGKVNSTKIGEYPLTYFVMNSKGNYVTASRIVRVINSETDLNVNISLSTEEVSPKLEIIVKIDGNGYNYTILPNGRITREKEIKYLVTENNTYKFNIYDINDKVEIKEIKVTNIGEIPKKVETFFTINYPMSLSTMRKIPNNLLSEYFVSKGFTSTDGKTYRLIINGEVIDYEISSGKLSYSGDYVYCDFYATIGSTLGLMENTITLLAGSGERASGAISNNRIPSNANLNDGSLLIAPRKDNDYNMSKHPKMVSICTRLGMFLAGNDVKNSIIGFSEGAQAASRTVSYNNVKYDIMVLVNGSAYYTSNNANLISNYQPFHDMEIILLEAKNNNDWNETIIKTVNNFLNNGVRSNNIKLFTSDSELISTLSSKISVIIASNTWSGHGSGYRIIRESNILSYLSSK